MSDQQFKTWKGGREKGGGGARARGYCEQGGQEAIEEAGAEEGGGLKERKESLESRKLASSAV